MQLVSFLEEVFPPNQKKTFCVIEYTLLHGVNDSEDDARSLAKLLQNVRCIVNLIGGCLCAVIDLFVRSASPNRLDDAMHLKLQCSTLSRALTSWLHLRTSHSASRTRFVSLE